MESSDIKKPKAAVAQTIIWFILGWTILYNVILKEQGWWDAFLGILDTITEDMVMGSLVTVLVGSITHRHRRSFSSTSRASSF